MKAKATSFRDALIGNDSKLSERAKETTAFLSREVKPLVEDRQNKYKKALDLIKKFKASDDFEKLCKEQEESLKQEISLIEKFDIKKFDTDKTQQEGCKNREDLPEENEAHHPLLSELNPLCEMDELAGILTDLRNIASFVVETIT